MPYTAVFYSFKLCFQFYVTSYMHHIGKKESEKEILKKEKQNKQKKK